ncbi:endothelial cell adhesion molecule a [Trichomycterus rosablanca]|uniref:endothelial cell adhesion molecule a n=1 Tax=Trichomycterus rosablanca TaxID=2290929 RepID=UPI002F358B4F
MESTSWLKLGNLLSVLLLCPGLLAQLELPQTNVEVIQGQKVMLQAYFTGVGDISKATVIWNLVSPAEMVISYVNGGVSYGSNFKNRVSFLSMPSNDLSIYINNTVESDSGQYTCQVVSSELSGAPKELTLTVKVPPSLPVCKLQGNPVLKGNVTLTCHSSAGKPVPKYKWYKTSPSTAFFYSPTLNETAGTLKLNNLSSNMSGKYECTATNSAGEGKCYINLEVVTASNAGVIAGATVGALVGLVLIILFVLFFWKRRKDSEEDLANDIKEDAQAPKRVSWAKSGTGSDVVSKNGTLSSVRSSPQPHDTSTFNHYHHYPVKQHTSDTASIVTTTGSTVYRPRAAGPSSPPEHPVPSYNADVMVPRPTPVPPASSSNGGSLPRTDAIKPPVQHYIPSSSGVSAANLSRMGAVPIMVPAQNQAGSLV